VSQGLIRDSLRYHLAPEALQIDEWVAGDELAVRVDHVLGGGRAGLLALRAFSSLGVAAPRVELALASADRGAGPATFETPEELQALHAAALRTGVRFSRPGHGRGDVVHRERFAVPGRILLLAGRRDSSAGALGMLVLAADPVEAAAALAGCPYYLEWPGVRFLKLEGVLPTGIDGHDAWLALAARLGPRGAEGAFLECIGAGVAGLEFPARNAVAGAGRALHARAVVFPSDEITREALRAQGREPEWKSFPAADPAPDDEVIELDLSALSPRFAPHDSVADGRPLEEAGEIAIDVVEIGPGVMLSELERLALRLAGRRMRDSVSLIVVPGSRQIMESARERGVLDRLTSAGARVLEPGTSGGAAGTATLRRQGLCVGVAPDPAADPRAGWWIAGIDACAAACVTGTLRDPRSVDLGSGSSAEPETYPSTGTWIIRPEAGTNGDTPGDDSPAPFPLGGVIDAPLRGSVLLIVGDGVAAETILPWGARIRPLLADIDRLAGFAFHSLDEGFAERARRQGGGWVVAGDRFGLGYAREPAALALLALGVRGVIAVSLAPDYRRQLVHAGLLPLRFVVPAERERIVEGDELEIPGLPDALWEGAPLVVRNLTSGTRFTVRHELNTRQLETVASGGLLKRAPRAEDGA
jgi:aconitate hydratase